ncbi:MAG: hypothetical protein AB7G23_20390 [Vicinamibacterales bacterium]
MDPSPREPERQDEIPRDSRPEQERRVRLSIPVPRLVDEVLRRSGRDPQDEINRVVGALFRKLTPQRGPSDKGPYAGEVHYFQRLLDAPTETLTLHELLLVDAITFQERLLERATVEGSEAVHAELRQLTADVAEWVDALQQLVRRERGEDMPQIDWEVTEP